MRMIFRMIASVFFFSLFVSCVFGLSFLVEPKKSDYDRVTQEQDQISDLIDNAFHYPDETVEQMEDIWGSNLIVEWSECKGLKLRMIRTIGPDKLYGTIDDIQCPCPTSLMP